MTKWWHFDLPLGLRRRGESSAIIYFDYMSDLSIVRFLRFSFSFCIGLTSIYCLSLRCLIISSSVPTKNTSVAPVHFLWLNGLNGKPVPWPPAHYRPALSVLRAPRQVDLTVLIASHLAGQTTSTGRIGPRRWKKRFLWKDECGFVAWLHFFVVGVLQQCGVQQNPNANWETRTRRLFPSGMLFRASLCIWSVNRAQSSTCYL